MDTSLIELTIRNRHRILRTDPDDGGHRWSGSFSHMDRATSSKFSVAWAMLTVTTIGIIIVTITTASMNYPIDLRFQTEHFGASFSGWSSVPLRNESLRHRERMLLHDSFYIQVLS
ncbi:uncharacterized protein LOC112495050 [Cephus cinctus]|uniref:Uncharacterized protein LOC112495050 n=1 Tax=Cephus cinctus TaxID=211228 RepID=A0AAJ7RR05_CEPCN|nr:uncharacterized protein LOC112495050 [Cephus cinctus]